MGDLFHDIYCGSKCVSMDESGIWSILTDTLHYVKPEIDSSVIYSYDQKRHQNSKSKYFDAAFSNIPNEDSNYSVDYTYNAKEENFDAANYNVLMFQFIHKHCFPSMRRIDMVILIYSLHLSLDLMKVFVQLIFGQKQIPAVLWKVRHMIWKETPCGLSKVSFL